MAKQRRPRQIAVTWDEQKREWAGEYGVTRGAKQKMEAAIKEFVAMRDERNRLIALLEEERKKTGDLIQVRLEAVRQGHQLEVIKLISQGKKEEAIASVLRKDVMLFGMEVRIANDGSLEKARQEWYEKGKTDCMAAIRNCTLAARQTEEQDGSK